MHLITCNIAKQGQNADSQTLSHLGCVSPQGNFAYTITPIIIYAIKIGINMIIVFDS